jgi:Bacterial PH domain
MSRNAPQIQQPQDDPWTPKRTQGGFRHVRRVGRGKNRHWEFKGQQPDEVVKTVLRKHVWFLITPAFPLIGSIIGLIIVGVLSANYPSAGSLWTLLEVIFAILILITLVFFLYNDLALWWVETDIITNKRVLIWKGLITPNRQEAPIENVVQIGVEQKTLLSLLLSYGDVHLNLVGGKGFVLDRVPSPKKVRDLFNRVTDEVKRSKPPKEPHPLPENTKLLDVLEKLSKNEPLPKLPNPDEKYARFHRPDRPPGPLRTFGGPLRLPCDVTYTTDEQTVLYIQRSKSVLVVRLILPVLLLAGLIISTFYLPSLTLYIVIAIFILLFVIGYSIINYIDDVFILTNKRIIDIDRKFLFINEEHLSTDYSQVKDVTVNIGNPFFLALDVGTVIVQTPGNNPNIEISPADHPFAIQDIIVAIKGHKDKVDKIKAKNERKNELNEWFGTVIATMEKTVLGRGVPNLQTLDLFAAAERAREFGMKVVPVGEDPSYPNIAPGHIVSQNPIPGTIVQFESNDPEQRPQIRVVLSRRP